MSGLTQEELDLISSLIDLKGWLNGARTELELEMDRRWRSENGALVGEVVSVDGCVIRGSGGDYSLRILTTRGMYWFVVRNRTVNIDGIVGGADKLNALLAAKYITSMTVGYGGTLLFTSSSGVKYELALALDSWGTATDYSLNGFAMELAAVMGADLTDWLRAWKSGHAASLRVALVCEELVQADEAHHALRDQVFGLDACASDVHRAWDCVHGMGIIS